MQSRKVKLTRKRATKQPIDALAKILTDRSGVFRRADLTPELRDRAGITPEDEFRLMAVTELHGMGIPLEVARALAFSGAVGSASELPALKPEEIENILSEASVKRLLPEGLQIDLGLIEQWLLRTSPVTADEEAAARDAVAEQKEAGAGADEDAALAAEDPWLNRKSMEELLNALGERWRRTQAALQALSARTGGQAEASAVHNAVRDLQTAMSEVLGRFTGRDTAAFAALEEAEATAFTEEGSKPEQDVRSLEAELKRLAAALDHVRLTAEAGDEERSPPAATEEHKQDAETALKGE